MGKFKGSSKCLNWASNLIVLSTVLSIAVPPNQFAWAAEATVSAGDTANPVPSVDKACTAIDHASAGDLFDLDGNPLSFTKEECLNNPNRRARNAPGCQTTAKELTALGKTIDADTICHRDPKALNQSAANYCALREINSDGQASKYCEAYKSAKNAQLSVGIALGLDVTAAGICWAEYMALKQKLSVYIKTKNYWADPEKKGVCAGASMAAGVAELAQTAKVLFSGEHSAGDYTIDSDTHQPSNKGFNLTKVFEMAASAGLSAWAMRIGICQYKPDTKIICDNRTQKINDKVTAATNSLTIAEKDSTFATQALKDANESLKTADSKLEAAQKAETLAEDNKTAAAEERTNAENEVFATACYRLDCSENSHNLHQKAVDRLAVAKKTLDKATDNLKDAKKTVEAANSAQRIASHNANIARDNVATLEGKAGAAEKAKVNAGVDRITTAMEARINLAYTSALIFSTLAVVRGSSLIASTGTMGQAKDILQSMFKSNTNGGNFGTSALSGAGNNAFANEGNSTFSQPTVTQPNQSSAVAAGSPEAFLLPPGASHTAEIQKVARQIPQAKLAEAAAGGAAGIGGMISSVAASDGAKGDLSAIRAAVSTVFANLPKDDSGYGSGSGGKLLASSGGSSSPDLNLKSLFSGSDKDKEERGAASADLAYRGPASDDIWHSQNPKGNNLFQIVSEKYDTVQRKRDLSP